MAGEYPLSELEALPELEVDPAAAPWSPVQRLQLELRRTQAAARAARLEARAAELELLIRQHLAQPALPAPVLPTETAPTPRAAAAPTIADSPRAEATLAPHFSAPTARPATERTAAPLTDWQPLLDSLRADQAPVRPCQDPDALASSPQRDGGEASSATPISEIATGPETIAASQSAGRPPAPAPGRSPARRVANRKAPAHQAASPKEPSQKEPSQKEPSQKEPVQKKPSPKGPAQKSPAQKAPAQKAPAQKAPVQKTPVQKTSALPPSRLADVPRSADVPQLVDVPRQEPGERRKRPAAWGFSTAVHLGLLLLLMGMTLSVPAPKDQIALSAVAPHPDESLETISLETLETPEEPASEAMIDRPLPTNPLGELAAAEREIVAEDLQRTGPSLDWLSDSLADATSALQTEGEMSTAFFGIEGGGNHFCYIVDNSKSMTGGRFEAARAELLRSIDQLGPEQRFYVMFYGREVIRMRISDPSTPEPYSVLATAENKQALRRWAMQVELIAGAGPVEALKIAAELRPDVIFLLTDGAMSERVVDHVAALNLREDLYGVPTPRSILHTIAFYSREGEAVLMRIAEANGGQYRFVPPPPRR